MTPEEFGTIIAYVLIAYVIVKLARKFKKNHKENEDERKT